MKHRILKIIFYTFFTLFFISCGSSRIVKSSNKEKETYEKEISKVKVTKATKPIKTTPDLEPEDNRVYNMINFARSFEGTKYKYGGTTDKGMDCSGLVYTTFLNENITLPRSSRDMALEGTRLHLKEITIGDLLFFETDKNRKVINHVGFVVEVLEDQILFIHSSTSRGVIISSLSENYWLDHFIMARRVI